MDIEEITKYRTSDGVEFSSRADAERYESLIGRELSKEDYLWMRRVSRGRYRHMLSGAKFGTEYKKGDIIHTVAYHYFEDPYGNNINRDIIFVNDSIISGTYVVESRESSSGGYRCTTVRTPLGDEPGSPAHVGDEVILENYAPMAGRD